MFCDSEVDSTAPMKEQEKEARNQKKKYYEVLCDIVNSVEFIMDQVGILGTPSI